MVYIRVVTSELEQTKANTRQKIWNIAHLAFSVMAIQESFVCRRYEWSLRVSYVAVLWNHKLNAAIYLFR